MNVNEILQFSYRQSEGDINNGYFSVDIYENLWKRLLIMLNTFAHNFGE